MELGDFSRFVHTPTIVLDGKETYGRWVQPDFLTTALTDDQIKTIQITASQEGRPDLISQMIYGTPLLDWVLIAFNDARDALNWPKSGDLIRYPIDSVVLPQLI